MYDAEAHKRIDVVEKQLENHFKQISNLEAAIVSNTSSLEENTKLTKDIANNTAELVELFKGAKVFRKFVIWTAGVATAITAIAALVSLIWQWIWGK